MCGTPGLYLGRVQTCCRLEIVTATERNSTAETLVGSFSLQLAKANQKVGVCASEGSSDVVAGSFSASPADIAPLG